MRLSALGSATSDYLAWLTNVVHQFDIEPSGSGDSWTAGYYPTLQPRPGSNPATELAKYNALDRTIDPAWGQQFLTLNSYYTNGEFAPGAPTATLEVMAQAERQWAHDSEPGMLDKVVQAAALAALAYVGYSVFTGGLSASTAASVVDAAPLMTQAEVDALVASAAPYSGEGYTLAQLVAPETVTAAANVAAGTATATQAATVAQTGLTASQILGTAKSVIGAAGTVATIAKMASGAVRINPATGTPYNLPPGYQPTVTPGGTSGQDVNYGGILKQLALPIGGLLAIFLLKG